jgi:hypothetical protein
MADKKKKKKIPQAKYAKAYPTVMNPELVGTYEPSAYAGGGYVWDEVLEYRVWCQPEQGAPDVADGSDYYYPFESYEEALAFSEATEGVEEPVALILQREYIDETEPDVYVCTGPRHGVHQWKI